MKKAILLLMLLAPVAAGVWQDRWHDESGQEWQFRRAINVSTQESSLFENEVVELEVSFGGALPYCQDWNTDSDLKDNNSDFVSLRVLNATPEGVLNETVFEVQSYTCASNELTSATIRFGADVPDKDSDNGWGQGTSLYWLYYTNESRLLQTGETGLPAQTANIDATESSEQRKLRETRWSWDYVPFRWRLCFTITNNADAWSLNTTTREDLTFSGVKPYCDDVNSDGAISSGEGGTLRMVQEFADGSYAELPLTVDAATCSDNNLTQARLTFVHDLPPSSQSVGFGNGINRFWIYYDNHTSSFPSYPSFTNTTPDFFASFCPTEDGPGCPSEDMFFAPGACCSGIHYWDLDDSPTCEGVCRSLGYNASLQCCGDELGEYFIGHDWVCMDSEVCLNPVDFDQDGAAFGDPDDTCGCNSTTDDGKSCDSEGDGEWNGFCVGEECIECKFALDFVCPNLNCMGVDPDCCDETNPCIAGLVCNTTLKRCIAPVGQFCMSDSDCLADSECKTNVCVAGKFAYLQLAEVGMGLGEATIIPLLIRDPQGRRATYGLRFVGDGRYFAKFYGTEGETELTLEPGETKEIPIQVVGATVGDFYITVVIWDKSSVVEGTPQILDSEDLEFHVRGESRATTLITAPGINTTDLFLLGMLATVIFWKKKKF